METIVILLMLSLNAKKSILIDHNYNAIVSGKSTLLKCPTTTNEYPRNPTNLA